MLLKDRFINAILSGELGETTNDGIVVTSRAFRKCFSDIKSDYINSFMPAATIEKGRCAISHTKYLFRLKNGIYRLHPDAITYYLSTREEK